MNSETHARESNLHNTRPESLSRTSTGVEADAAPEDRHAKLTPGSTIPDTRLEIVRWLGQGGMGTVFEVRHLDIERHFALKLLHRSGSIARARRFRREAKTIGNIGSPWIVDIFDFKELADGRLLYLMELVEGPSLHQLLREAKTFELGRLIGIARQICKGLTDAHARGFIHRDIKPENVMLWTDAAGREHVKIVDFGLAGLLVDPNESSRAGTPTHMSPEQCKGEPADARTDIYSLGVTLYELGCGRLPFVREDQSTLRDDHVLNQPEPPSAVIQTGSLPPSFDALVLRCMAKRPEDRFASALELEAGLIELQLELGLRTDWDHLPAPALGDDRSRKLEQGLANLRRDRQRDRARRSLIAAAIVSVVALSAGLGWWAGADSRAAVVAQVEADLAALRVQAQRAGSAQRWIYPTAQQPDASTAYRLLLELESLDIADAKEIGQELRREFSTGLLEVADSYWDRPGGRGFAREFYAQVLVFDPDQARALERSGLSRTATSALRQRAASGKFDAQELVDVAPLEILAQPDSQARLAGLVTIHADAEQLPASVAASLDRLIEDLERELPEGAVQVSRADGQRGSMPDQAERAEPTDAPLENTDAEPLETKQAEPSDTARNRSESAALASRAKSAYLAGHGNEAERLYHRSLELDGSSAAALLGLHHLHFDRGNYKDALAYAKKARALQPNRADLNLYVGDSCMKVLDYSCARTHYERAAKLGDEQASQRLKMLAERLGGSNGGGSR